MFDGRAKTISRGGRVLALYDAVQCISIIVHEEGGEAVSWSVRIDLGIVRKISIGDSDDSSNASIAAAHIASATGKKVRVL